MRLDVPCGRRAEDRQRAVRPSVRRIGRDLCGINPRRRVRIAVRQNDAYDDVLAGRGLTAANFQLFAVDNGELVVLVLAVELVQLLDDPVGRYVREQEGNRDETGLGQAVSLDDENLAVACDAIENLARRASQFHHLQGLEIDFQ